MMKCILPSFLPSQKVLIKMDFLHLCILYMAVQFLIWFLTLLNNIVCIHSFSIYHVLTRLQEFMIY